MMYFDENAEKIISQQEPREEVIDNIMIPIINNKKMEGSIFSMVFYAYYMGEINGKQEERARRARDNHRAGIPKELPDFMRLFYQIIEGKADDMTIGDLYAAKDKYGLSNEEVRMIFSL